MGSKLRDDVLKWTIDINGNPARKGLNDLNQATRTLEKTNKDLRIELQKMEANGKKNTQEYKNLSKQLTANNKTITANKAKMAALRKELGINNLTARELRSEYKRLKNQMDGLDPNSAEWKKLNGNLGAVKGRMGELRTAGQKTNKMFGALKQLLPVLGIGAVVTLVANLGKELFNLAIQLEGDNRRAAIVFGDSMKYVETQAESLSKAMGLTNKEFVAAAANTADLLIPLDFTREAAAEMSVELQSMAGALDEWTGGRLGAAEVSNILTKAMLGENEQLKQLGIAIRKDTDEFRDLVKEKLATTDATKVQAEAMATLELIQKKSADAQAAYTMEGNKLLRFQKELSVSFKQAKENLVEFITDGLKSASSVFNEQAKEVKYLEDNIVPLISSYEKLATKSSLSESEQSDLNDMIITIGSNLPGAITQFDEYGKVIAISADKAKELIKQQKAMLLVKNADAIKEQEDELTRVNTEMGRYRYMLDEGAKGLTRMGSKIVLTTKDVKNYTARIAELGQQKLGIEGLLKVLKGISLVDLDPDPDPEKKMLTYIEYAKKHFEAYNEWLKQQGEVLENENSQKQADTLDKEFQEWVKLKEEEYKKKETAEKEMQQRFQDALNEDFDFDEEPNIEDDPAVVRAMAIAAAENEITKATYTERLDDLNEMLDKGLISEEEYQNKLKALNNARLDTQMKRYTQYISGMMMALDAYSVYLRAQKDKELEAAGDNEAEMERIKIKYAKKEQNIAIGQANMRAALAIINLWSNNVMPYPAAAIFNGVMSAVIAGVMVAQIANIKSAQYATGNRAQIIGADDGKAYNAKVVNSNHRSGLFNEPTYVPGFGLFGETPKPELVFNPYDTQMIMNSPALIDAINHTIQPQFASGNNTEVIRERETAFTDPALMAMLAKLDAKLDQPATAVLLADEDYNRTHNDTQNKFNNFQNKVN